ncbi:MAG: S8 family serine peptidase [Verrucomicrobia bacterium]|nr:S8 family serine peptidase [Verrucomicrobiota bacterium]
MKRLLHIAFCLLLLTHTVSAATTNTLTWSHSENRVDADIRTWHLQTLLEEISAASGWDIMMEPGTSHTVSVKFSNFTIERALPRLLGKLSYALLPQTNGPPKFCVYTTSMGKATQLVRHTLKGKDDKSKAILNELVVTLDPSSSFTIEELAKMLGAKIVGRIDGRNTYLLRFDDEADANAAREKLSENPNVANVDNNYTIDPPPDSLAASDSSAPPFKLKATAIGDPNNLIVGLIDSHVQKLDPNMQQFLLPPIEVAGKPSADGELSHGTSMAQTLLQGLTAGSENADTSKVKILPVDVYGTRSSTTTFDVASGIVQAVNKGAMGINLSLGSSGNSHILHNVIQDSSAQGVVFFAAAGNTPVTTPTYPAAYPEVMAVTAGDRNKNLAPYANYGSFVEVIGPGGAMVSYGGQAHYVGGTSVATAYITGLALGAADISGKPLGAVQTVIRQNLGFLPPAR